MLMTLAWMILQNQFTVGIILFHITTWGCLWGLILEGFQHGNSSLISFEKNSLHGKGECQVWPVAFSLSKVC